MITCPNCNHQNPEGALQCEACYTPLPIMMACPTCGTPVQANASFCGQCGSDLRSLSAGEASAANPSAESAAVSGTAVSAVPESTLKTQNFLAENELAASTGSYITSSEVTPDPAALSEGSANLELPDLVAPDPLLIPEPMGSDPAEANQLSSEPIEQPVIEQPVVPPASPMQAATQLQTLSARLRHVQTGTLIEIPRQLSIVRIGKPSEQTPPDIDVSGFPDSEVVSRVHANLRVEGDIYYIEDVGSSNGTYVNGLPLAAGNRHRLRPGDRIALGKGDKVSFIFETA